MPASARDALRAFEDLASPHAAFVREHCVLDPEAWVQKDQLFGRWRVFCGNRPAGDKIQFTKDLMACCPHVQSEDKKRRVNGKLVPVYLGIRLKTDAEREAE